jgi:hypothetical protein
MLKAKKFLATATKDELIDMILTMNLCKKCTLHDHLDNQGTTKCCKAKGATK